MRLSRARMGRDRTMATYTLPELPYDYAALEPHISAQIMQLHHDKHHATYVAGANTALEQLAEARETGGFGTINKLEKDLAFHLGGHTNHSIFWTNLSPEGHERPEGDMAAAVDEYFGSFEGFQGQFGAAALGIQGSGWAGLFWDSIGQRLIIQQFFDQQSQFAAGTVPILLLDMWSTHSTSTTRTSRATTSRRSGTSSTGRKPSSSASTPRVRRLRASW